MSKRILALAMAIITLFLVGCDGGSSKNNDENLGVEIKGEIENAQNGGNNMSKTDGFVLKAVVQGVYDDRIEVEVIESNYAFGVYWVRTGEQTDYKFADGSSATRSDIEAGQTINITYNGQTMMSLPPQIVAYKIVIE